MSWFTPKPPTPKYVRIHQRDNGPTISGFLVGIWAGHYVVDVAKLHATADQVIPLEGRVEVPARNVSFLQNLVAVVDDT